MTATLSPSLSRTEADFVAKKKPGRPKGEPKKALYVEIPAKLRDKVDRALIRERRELNTFVAIALEKYLEELGCSDPPIGNR